MPSPTNPVVLITGCSKGGIGYSLVKAFSAHPVTIYATSRRQEAKIRKMKHMHPACKLIPLILDVTDRVNVHSVIESIIQHQKRLDIVINNAAMNLAGPLAEMYLLGFKWLIETNVIGILNVIQEVVPHMAAARHGFIFNLGSVAGSSISLPWSGAYCASKAAVKSITNTLRMELKPFNISVSLLIPTGVKTNIGRNSRILHEYIYKQPDSIQNSEAAKASEASTISTCKRVVQEEILHEGDVRPSFRDKPLLPPKVPARNSLETSSKRLSLKSDKRSVTRKSIYSYKHLPIPPVAHLSAPKQIPEIADHMKQYVVHINSSSKRSVDCQDSTSTDDCAVKTVKAILFYHSSGKLAPTTIRMGPSILWTLTSFLYAFLALMLPSAIQEYLIEKYYSI